MLADVPKDELHAALHDENFDDDEEDEDRSTIANSDDDNFIEADGAIGCVLKERR